MNAASHRLRPAGVSERHVSDAARIGVSELRQDISRSDLGADEAESAAAAGQQDPRLGRDDGGALRGQRGPKGAFHRRIHGPSRDLRDTHILETGAKRAERTDEDQNALGQLFRIRACVLCFILSGSSRTSWLPSLM